MPESPLTATLAALEEPSLSLTWLDDTETRVEAASRESPNEAVEEAPSLFQQAVTEEWSKRGEARDDPLGEATLLRLRGIASSRISDTRRSVEEEDRGRDDVSMSLSSSLMRQGAGGRSMTSSLWK